LIVVTLKTGKERFEIGVVVGGGSEVVGGGSEVVGEGYEADVIGVDVIFNPAVDETYESFENP